MLSNSNLNFSFSPFNSSFKDTLYSLISSANDYIILSTSSLSDFNLTESSTLYNMLIRKCEKDVKCLIILKEHIDSENINLSYLKDHNINVVIDETNTLNSIITENSIYTGSMAFSYNASKTLINSYFICNKQESPTLYESIKENYISKFKSVGKTQFELLNTNFSTQIEESRKTLSSLLNFANVKSTDSCCFVKKYLKENINNIEEELLKVNHICFYKCDYSYYEEISSSLLSIKNALSSVVKECECFDCGKGEYHIFENSELLNGLIRLNRNFSILLDFLNLSKNKFNNNTFNFSAQTFHNLLSI